MIRRTLLQTILFFSLFAAKAQTPVPVVQSSNPELIPIHLEHVSPALRDLPENPPTARDLSGVRPVHDNPSLEHPMHAVNPHALPIGEDPVLQKAMELRTGSAAAVTVLSNWTGLTAAVEPSDNNIAVGPNHVVQMTNNNVSTSIRIWNKAGTLLVSNRLVQSITGITDYGDPNILYDQVADRFLMVVLYSKSAKKLVVCVSQTPDPTGAYYVYSFNTPDGFPDYPKIGAWNNSYIITTNSKYPTIYALNRAAVLAGQGTGNVQMFALSKLPRISFQSASPISQTGNTPPPANEPASIIRVADDSWSTTVGADHLELFNLNIDWNNSVNSTITGPINLPTAAYNSNLCGYSSSSCIPQPGSTVKLDPLSDIVMDKVQYRNLGNYESIVCSHVCNADGNGTAGIRWYELRRDGNGNWYIYQQSTYSSGTDHRFMSSITINGNGTIALGYNISSTTVYPGIRVTGRNTCDALNQMTATETTAKNGAAANSSVRYGDYNGMMTDPTDGSFWFTANYNLTADWSTNVVHFSINDCPPLREAPTDNMVARLDIAPNPASTEIDITFNSNCIQTASLTIMDITGKTVVEQRQYLAAGVNHSTVDIQPLSNGCYFVKLTSSDGISVQRLVIQR